MIVHEAPCHASPRPRCASPQAPRGRRRQGRTAPRFPPRHQSLAGQLLTPAVALAGKVGGGGQCSSGQVQMPDEPSPLHTLVGLRGRRPIMAHESSSPEAFVHVPGHHTPLGPGLARRPSCSPSTVMPGWRRGPAAGLSVRSPGDVWL